MRKTLAKLFDKSRILHAVETHEIKDEKERERIKRAQTSWRSLYRSGGAAPCHYTRYTRTAESIGDTRGLPFLKDALLEALCEARKKDIIMLTNDDIILHPLLPATLMRQIRLYDACSSHRCEFHYAPMPSLECSPDVFACRAEWHMGRDLFAFSKPWLEDNWDDIPDFILGASDWDLCLAAMIRHKKGFDTTKNNYLEIIPCCELPLGYVIHEWHQSRWSLPDNVNSAPSQIHNRRLFRQWCHKRMLNLEFSDESTIK